MSEEKTSLKQKIIFSEIISLLYIPLTAVFLEIVLRIKSELDVTAFLLPLVLFSLSLGFLLSTVIMLIKNSLIRKVLGGAVIFALCLYFVVEIFVRDSYQTFMNINSIASGTGGVLTDFSDAFIQAVTGGFLAILISFLPFLIYIGLICFKFAFGVSEKNALSFISVSLVLATVLSVCGAKTVRSGEISRGIYTEAYNFDNAVCSFGLITGTRLDFQYSIFGNPADDDFVMDIPQEPETPVIIITPEEDTSLGEESEPEIEIEYGYNVLDIDFDTIIAETTDNTLLGVHQYVSSLTGTKQNEYTGLFKGKNLILIAAESFAKEVIDPELTPTLYRLSENGFTFGDFYQPTWGGSTSTGEFSIFSGIVPTSGVTSLQRLTEGNTDFTIGNKLRDEGYFSAAYHNGSLTYYSRHLTHTKLGYDTFTAFGNGLEEGVDQSVWPSSDLEMLRFTLPDYIDKEPFSIYYMSVSGHGFYANFYHGIANRNRDAVSHLECSPTLQAYYAANLELEYALAYLVEELENAGIADDTVIVITADHYPYALEEGESWGNDKDYLAELYGYKVTNNAERDHNALIIWSGCLENEHKDLAVDIDEPCYTLDILPTLCNLFGVPYDSRLLVGRDVFSDAEGLVLWPDYNWKTEFGYYNYSTGKFIPTEEGTEISDSYIDYINGLVKNRITYSKAVLNRNYFDIVLPDSE